MLLRNPFFLFSIVNFLQLELARSSSSSCHAASLVAWAEEPTTLSYDTSSPRLPGWPLHLGVPLPPWNSKDKKCCLYETPCAAAPVRVLGDLIAKTTAYKLIPLDAPTRTRIFSWFTSDVFLWRPVSSYQDSYVHFLWEVLRAKVVTERTTYCAWGVPWWVPLSVSSRILFSDMASWARTSRSQSSRWPQERDAEQSGPTNARHTHCTPRQLWTKADQRYDVPWDWLWDACQLARVRWGTRCKGFCSKEGPHYCIKWIARNPLERDQVQRALGKSSRSCCQTSNNQP